MANNTSEERAIRKNQLISMLRAIPGNPYVLVPMDEGQRFFAGACSVEESGREHKVILIRRIKKIRKPSDKWIAEKDKQKQEEIDELNKLWGKE